ncbi:MAG: response regulator [Acidobacteria bacterium]|nr:response regulator [Acidobacteriota bacterium]NIM62966.1 response regulator [Acidobacteriota bacterium]NIO57891.1 response regulator [Acidobacteriota bacterium]NIQ86110.1 response regulator [Acidobacteriota bacterium]NIT11615.1 response regulator [Acidobacteriota bacterium]
MSKAVFTTFETAKLCHVSPLSIINWVNAGRLPAFRTPGGHRRIRREDLIRFMKDNGIPLPTDLQDGSGKPRVLVVDDEETIRELLSEHLQSRTPSYEVLGASDGFEAGRLVATFKPDVVLLDLRMPGLDGFQICRTIKAAPESASTTVIAITGFYSPEIEARILECGALKCFAKPIDPETLSSCIDAVFEQRASKGKRRRTRS